MPRALARLGGMGFANSQKIGLGYYALHGAQKSTQCAARTVRLKGKRGNEAGLEAFVPVSPEAASDFN